MAEPQAPDARMRALAQYAERVNTHPSLQHFGARVAFPDESRVTVLVEPVPITLRGGFGDDRVVNGGVLSALCDLLIGCTAALIDPAARSATVQLSIRLEQPLLGERITGEARVDRSTGRLVFSSAEIHDESGKVCVRCQGMVSRGAGAKA
jgi:acyl-coenzyme A thioesterase PaaI-like protein